MGNSKEFPAGWEDQVEAFEEEMRRILEEQGERVPDGVRPSEWLQARREQATHCGSADAPAPTSDLVPLSKVG